MRSPAKLLQTTGMERQHNSGTDPSNINCLSTESSSHSGQWQPGESGNPAGRPVGSKNRKSQLTLQIEEQGSLVAQRVIEAALAGDIQAVKPSPRRLMYYPPIFRKTLT